MPADAYGLPVTATSREAVEEYDGGVRGLLAWSADTLDHFQGSLGHDPQLALAHAGAAVCHFLDERFKEARAAADTARAAAQSQTGREQGHASSSSSRAASPRCSR